MKKFRFLVIVAMVITIPAFAALAVSAYDSFSAAMGFDTHEDYLAAQAIIDANGGHPPDDGSIAALFDGATGVKGDFDHDGIPDNQQTSKSTTQTTTQPTQKKDSQTTQKTETAETTETAEATEAAEEPVHEHNYRKEITTMPTCTEEGVETYTCDCGDTYTEKIPAKGHDEGEWVTEVEPTCTTPGKEVRKCTTCGEVLEEREIPALGHKPGEWEVTKQADWIHDGEQIKKCTVCGEILETQVIPANHVPLFIIGGCVLAVIILIVVIVCVKKKGKSKDKDKPKE